MDKFNQTTPQVQTPPPPNYAEKSFLWSWVAGVGLPLVQAFVTGVMAMILTVVMIYAFNGVDYVKPAIVVGALVSTFTWYVLQRRWLKLTELEKFLKIDLNGGGIGQDPKPETVVRVDKIKGNGHYESSRYTFKITEDQLIAFAEGVVNEGRPISRREWTPKATNGFSEGEWKSFQSDLIKLALIEVGEGGYILTEDGQDFFEGYVGSPSPT